MRATLADARLARFAGRFVWLELDFDKPGNQAFMARHGVMNTPTFFVLDPADEHATATQFGAMTLPELKQFLDRGERGVTAKPKTPAEAALARGDELLATERRSEAADSFGEAIRLGGSRWPERNRAVGSYAFALMSSGQSQPCAEIAVAEAPRMTRNEMFGRVVFAGLSCVSQDPSAAWARAANRVLEPLAAEAITLPSTVRDHRFQLYQTLMSIAQARGDKATAARWGDRWLSELDATRPASEDERSALDIARVDAASILGDPSRVLPALIASEQAMPNNYNASLRRAQIEVLAGRNDDAIAACDRGLVHVTGPFGRSWLLQTKADALVQKGRLAEAHRVLEEALRAAQAIGVGMARDMSVTMITNALKKTQKATN